MPLALLYRSLNDLGGIPGFLPIYLKCTCQVQLRIHADDLALIMSDFKHVTRFDLAKSLAGFIESRNRCQLADIEFMFTK